MKPDVRLAASAAFAALLCGVSPASAQIGPPLGLAQGFAVLGATTVTNTGLTVVTGDLGVSPGTAVTGFPPGVVVGTIHAGNATAAGAQTSASAAYNNLAGQACSTVLTGQNLGGLTLTPGVYCFASSAQLTGILTLDAQGNPNAVFIFQIGSTLTTASNSAVVVINGGLDCNVFWQVGSSATLGTATVFRGNILALTSITLTTGANLLGRALAQNGAVTLDTNAVVACGAVPPPVCPTITLAPPTLPNGTVGTAYSQTVTGSGGTAPYTFDVTAGGLPAGLTLTPSGVISGTPTTAGMSTFTIRATDGNGCFGARSYTVNIAPAGPPPPPGCPTITLIPQTLPNGTVGIAYTQTIMGSGGTAPYTFGVTTGTPPPGLTLSPAGVLSGTPTTAGMSTFTIRATDANGCFAQLSYTITIAAAPPPPPVCPAITLTPLSLPNGTMGTAYSQTIMGNGGTAPYTFGVTAGSLPPGLTLTPAGLISGTPTSTGMSGFTVRGTDANGCFGTRPYTITILAAPPPPPLCPTIALTPTTLPNATGGIPYSQTIVGSGGTAPYTFGLTAGALPGGLTLTSAGVVSGTPTTAGMSGFTIRGTDALGCFAELSFTMTIGPALPVPTLSQTFIVLLALVLMGVGYLRLRRPARAE